MDFLCGEDGDWIFSLLGLVPYTEGTQTRKCPSGRVLLATQAAFRKAEWSGRHLPPPCLPVLFLEAVMFNNSGGACISISYSIFDVPTNRLQTVSFQLAPLLPTKAQQNPLSEGQASLQPVLGQFWAPCVHSAMALHCRPLSLSLLLFSWCHFTWDQVTFSNPEIRARLHFQASSDLPS